MKESRGEFNPCLFNGFIYLCGSGSQLVEAFSPHTDSFLPLQVGVPEIRACCLFVHNDLLVVHSYQHISKFAAGQAGQLVLHSQVPAQIAASKLSNSQPVVDSIRGFYFLFYEGKVFTINLETGVKLRLI